MAGARTQGVGRGVNWGAFGSMGQQYAQIGRTIESGGEALGKGIGGGLAAIGGAIERKKVRDQQAAERQAARADEQARFDTLRGDRLAENAFDNDFRERQFSALLAEQRADNARLEGEATRRMLSSQRDFFAGMYEKTGDESYLEQAIKAHEYSMQGQGSLAGGAGASPAVGSPSVGGGLSEDGMSSSAVERPSKEALGDLLGEQAANKSMIPGYAEPLRILPPGILQIAKAGALEQMINQRKRDLAMLSKKPKDDLKRRALEREIGIYAAKSEKIVKAIELRGMAQANNLRAEKERRAEEASVRSESRDARSVTALENSTRQIEFAANRDRRAQEDQEAQRKAEQAKAAADLAKAEAERVKRAGAMLKTRKAVLDEAALPLPSDPRDDGKGGLITAADIKNLKTSRIDSMDTSQIALAFTDNVTDEQAKALAGALLRRHGRTNDPVENARVAAQAVIDALPEEEQTQATSLRVLTAFGLDLNGNPIKPKAK